MRSQKNTLKGNLRRLDSQSLGVPRCGRGSEDSQVSDLEGCVDDGSVVHEGRAGLGARTRNLEKKRDVSHK